MSVFLAIDLPAQPRAQVTTLIETHRATVEARWLREDKTHLTLVFLGNATADQVAAFQPALEALVRGRTPFTLRLARAGTFVTARAPSVLWLGVEGDLTALNRLQQDAVSGLIGAEDRPYVPHVTLGRAKREGAFEGLKTGLEAFTSIEFRVDTLTLFESTHQHYRALSTHRFTPARAT
jgi:2'-5' RNA ligase